MRKVLVCCVFCTILGFGIGIKLGGGSLEMDNKYSYLARRIFIGNPTDVIVSFVDLRKKLEEYFGSTDNHRIGIYFEYLPTGASIGVNDREPFFRASLIKVPTVMRAYKLLEEGKIKRDETYDINRENIDQGYGDLWKKGGTKVSFDTVVEEILTKSDNTAFQILNDRINQVLGGSENDEKQKSVTNVYDYLDIPTITGDDVQNVTPKNFSSILKSLYFSAYLSFDSSEEILDIMTRSIFGDWIPAGVDKKVKVAHKVGVFDSGDKRIFSDCGIVYYPNRPYLLCIMTSSLDYGIAQKNIQELSRMVFEYVDGARVSK